MTLPLSDVELIKTHITNRDANSASFKASKTREIALSFIAGDMKLPTREEFEALLKKRPYQEPGQQKMTVWLLKVIVPGLDETADASACFRGFRFRSDSDRLLANAQTAYAQVKEAAQWCDVFICGLAALRADARTPEEVWVLKQYKRYFDPAVDKTRLAKVKQIFSNANQAINKEKFEFCCEADDGAKEHVIYGGGQMDRIHAFVRKSEKLNRIYISSMFFETFAEPFRGAGTLMHELTHLPRVGDTEDEIKIDATTAGCLELAIKSPDQACNNAENYGLFAMKVLARLKKGAAAVARDDEKK